METTGKDLREFVSWVDEAAHWLRTDAPFGLLAHGTAHDPAFVYANRTVSGASGYSWDEVTRMPSRLSAASHRQKNRDAFVRSVHSRGRRRPRAGSVVLPRRTAGTRCHSVRSPSGRIILHSGGRLSSVTSRTSIPATPA
ncbi:MEKHLA domain-containing protein [Streptomyces sp. NPDC020766]|uniref:MEKHLA domain-containing protein n=1 Tax=Streptomyces sp. NPDC020766 TaxID=3155011 RepID=UPI0034072C8A